MFKKMPGEEPSRIVSTTPDTAVVFKPAVVKTPAIITFIVLGWRAVVSLVLTVWRHPVAVLVVTVPCALSVLYGWRTALLLVTPVLVGILSWGILDRPTFMRWIGWRLLAWWRLVAVYRRHWQPVMIVSGLGRHIRDATTCPSSARSPVPRGPTW